MINGASWSGSWRQRGPCGARFEVSAMKHAMFCCGSVVMAVTLALYAAPSMAAESFAGKTITISVPVAPGGGYDTYARLVARHIRKHLPGQPTVIVKNM